MLGRERRFLVASVVHSRSRFLAYPCSWTTESSRELCVKLGDTSPSNRLSRSSDRLSTTTSVTTASVEATSIRKSTGEMTAPRPVMSFLLHRHGMRTPFVHFDGIGAPVEEANLGTLTERGQKQMQALGSFLAIKHGAPSKNGSVTPMAPARAAFLSAELLNPKVLSSSTPRCMESARILFKAFLGKDIEITKFNTDYAAFYHTMIDRNVEFMMAKEFETSHGKTVGDYVNFLNDCAGSTYTTMEKRYQIVEALVVAQMNGFQLQPYADIDTLERCLNVMLRQLLKGFEKDLAIDSLKDIKQRLEALPKVDVNWMSYSMSDINVVPTLEFLGIPISHWPEFASAFELRILSDGSAILDQIDNSPEAEVTEKVSIHKTTVDQLKANIDKVLAGE